jgi:hypothetical protein
MCFTLATSYSFHGSATNIDMSNILSTLSPNEYEMIEVAAHNFGYDNVSTMLQHLELTNIDDYSDNIIDINDDGDCDVEDAMLILLFLNGDYHYINGATKRNIKDLDVNGDLIIDQDDAWLYFEFYMAILDGSIDNFYPAAHNLLNTYEVYEADNFYLNRTYKKCNLTSTGTIDTNSIETYNICWDCPCLSSNTSKSDQRSVTDYVLNPVIPSSIQGVVKLTNSGSGFIIDEHTIATAAHCIYNTNSNSFVPVQIQIYDSNMNLITTITPTSLHVPYEFSDHNSIPGAQPVSNYDYGLITVSDSIDLTTYGLFSLGVSTYGLMSTQKAVTDCAYVQYGNSFNLYQTQGNLVYWPQDMMSGNEYPFVFSFNISTMNNCSGAPLYTTINDMSTSNATPKTVLGIVTGGAYDYGLGIRIMPTVLRFFYQNPKI